MKGWEKVTLDSLSHIPQFKTRMPQILKNNSETINLSSTTTKSKYGANKCEIDGIVFESQKEGRVYSELKMLERAGKISDLHLQVPFELQPEFILEGKKIRAIKYIADFTYLDEDTGEYVVVDCKGMRTQVYNIKKKLFEYKYHKEIKEV